MMSFVKRFFGSAAPATNALKEVILKETASNEVVIYSKSYCPHCHRTKSMFESEFPGKKTLVYELDQIKDGSAIQSTLGEITGQRTVPNVWVMGKHIGGNSETQALLSDGKLKEMLS